MRIMTVYGTRPEAIKVAPLILAIRSAPGLESIAVVTGQHREMLDQVNDMFGIEPDHDLNIMRGGQSLNEIVANVVTGLDSVLEEEKPDAVLVQGDTSTVMAAAIGAFNRRIPVIHVEAGLRSGHLLSPFPEEANRRLTTQVTSLHLAPTPRSRDNLLAEGISGDDIIVTGNSVIDALISASQNPDIRLTDDRLEQLRSAHDSGDSTAPVLLVTAHRRENLGDPMRQIGQALADLADRHPDLTIVFPIHRNPMVRDSILPTVEGRQNIILVEPLSYAEFTQMLRIASIVLTDSGGVQEEAPSLGIPVLVMRENTERPEAVAAGTVSLIGASRERIVREVTRLLKCAAAYETMADAVNPYGDGRAAERTLQAIRWKFLGGDRPEEFAPTVDGRSVPASC
ncbi:UDP-N-acetylglucosamine 2-epimerase (non-hydrolyzing) [Helcobacillus massiliensis]|uniref:non-hydrolyzing UDP-N-acetylglucosamine 2-epimerase n=1 Tax=Helcobacillus massiliensis TaxID=521392 RepID=UPI0021A599F3|nr:UDP-N-acetylglucosamine 2-epimerase (non-hydrolyzing) [Helcobacillus massiliensis]MCT2035901.1 UDP-N-acetylglucosamine 2-epimerase (non-hydrolyzing) [Helcobacillus massiliensis]MCT2331829.1 UDP-N-acetylglucosamine 2-epimerase (non-hydrolyzing) [Helcobacillus massiliensis]